MFTKMSFAVFAAAVAMLAGREVALAANDTPNERDDGINAHQIELDNQYARSHPTITPGTPARNGSSYGYVPPHRPPVTSEGKCFVNTNNGNYGWTDCRRH